MTVDGGDPSVSKQAGLADIGLRLDQLTDLFRRRLAEDRVKAAAFEELRAEIKFARAGLSNMVVRPLALGIIGVIDRIESNSEPDDGFIGSLVEELLDVLSTVGVVQIEAVGVVDPRLHAVQSVSGGSGHLVVEQLIRRGFTIENAVLRPAHVAAIRLEPSE